MRKLTRIILLILPLGFLVLGIGAEAQSRPICAPVTTPVVTTDLLGAGSGLPADPTGGAPEICIHIYETEGPGEFRFRGPIPLPLPTPLTPFEYAFTPITGVVGDYTVFPMLISYEPSPVPPGFVITMTGTVTRTAMTNPIPNTLVMNVLVGWNTGVFEPNLDLVLDVDTGGPSVTYLWGAPLFPNGLMTPLDDVRIRGGLPPIEFTSFGDEAPITLQLVDIPAFYPGQTAVGFNSGASFQINNVGDATIIPTGAGIRIPGSPPSIAPAGSAPFTAPKGPHYQCYKVEKHAPRPDELTIWVALEDQFGSTEQKLGEIVRICTPVSKNGEGFDGHPTRSPDTTTPVSQLIISPAAPSVPAASPATPQNDEEGFPEIHLVCYKIVEGEKLDKDVLMTNQFGLATEKIKQPKELCVPSYKKVLEKEEYQKEQQPEPEPGPKPQVTEVGVVPAGSYKEMLPACLEIGFSREESCAVDLAPGNCSGSVVRLTLTSGTATSSVSAQDCLDQLSSTVDTYCVGLGRPGDCIGSCPSGECKDIGETTNGQTTHNGPPIWECEATRGRCYCDCR